MDWLVDAEAWANRTGWQSRLLCLLKVIKIPEKG